MLYWVLAREPGRMLGAIQESGKTLEEALEVVKELAGQFPEDTLLYVQGSHARPYGGQNVYRVSASGEAVRSPWVPAKEDSLAMARQALRAKKSSERESRREFLKGRMDELVGEGSESELGTWDVRDLARNVRELEAGEETEMEFGRGMYWGSRVKADLSGARDLQGRLRRFKEERPAPKSGKEITPEFMDAMGAPPKLTVGELDEISSLSELTVEGRRDRLWKDFTKDYRGEVGKYRGDLEEAFPEVEWEWRDL